MEAKTQEKVNRNSSSSSTQVILEARNISKSFPGVQALDAVNVELREGEILGLVGENGAGKSTLMKILTGIYSADAGELILREKDFCPGNSLEAGREGVGMVHQELSLIPNLSAAENIYLGREERFLKWGIIHWKKMWREAENRLAQLGCSIDPRAYTASLSFPDRQMVEIARVIALEDELRYKPVIILDEPTTALSREEINSLFNIMPKLAKMEYSIIFISHRLEEVLEVAGRIYVLRDGKNVATLLSRDTDSSHLQKLMVGRERRKEYYQESKQTTYTDEVVLRAKNLNKMGAFYDVDIELHRGEVIGIAGVKGSGKEQLARALFGIIQPDRGEIFIREERVKLKSPLNAINRRIGYIPEERGEEGLILYFSLPPNITLPDLRSMTIGGILSLRKERNLGKKWIKELNIKAPHMQTLCINLSGGNQQKVVVAKWLETNVDVLITDHPTRGLDVGAKEEVYSLIRQLTGKGISIILISDSLEEIIGLSNTMLVMKDGRIQKSLDAPPGSKPIPEELIKYMV